MAAEEGQLVREAADEGGRAGEDAVVAMRSARGRKRKQGWQSVGSEEMLASENLRQAAQRWLKQHHILHETLQRSSDAGVRTLLAKCGECQSCTRQWCFRQSGSELRVERVGECTEGDKRVDRIRQLQNVRNSPMGGVAHYSLACIGELREFLDKPPPGVQLVEDMLELGPGCVRIPFSYPDVDEVLRASGLTKVLMDFTFQTNREGLLLGAVGPVGLHVDAKCGVTMRFIPTFFMLCTAEDSAAQQALMRRYVEHVRSMGIVPTDCFLDCSCYQGVAALCEEQDLGLKLHRCLQHVKTNVKTEASRKDSTTGAPRLGRKELLPNIIDWIEFSASLPPGAEFSAFWTSILDRMKSSASETDFAEPAMARYLEEHILQSPGLFDAPWMSGYGTTPLGYTTYAPNSIEVSHRVLKGLMGKTCGRQSVPQCLYEVCDSVGTRLEEGFYNGLVDAVQ
ncbi:unnamed protein product, partial [Symbiodinium microadriaticum]